MTVLLQVPFDETEGSHSVLLVEAARTDLPEGDLTLASPEPGRAMARATRAVDEALRELRPLLAAVREELAGAAPEEFAVEFGVKFGGETGVILAKGTAEVNLKITMTWRQG